MPNARIVAYCIVGDPLKRDWEILGLTAKAKPGDHAYGRFPTREAACIAVRSLRAIEAHHAPVIAGALAAHVAATDNLTAAIRGALSRIRITPVKP